MREGADAENLAMPGHTAMSCLKQEQTTKVAIQAKRPRAIVDEGFLLKVLGENLITLRRILTPIRGGLECAWLAIDVTDRYT